MMNEPQTDRGNDNERDLSTDGTDPDVVDERDDDDRPGDLDETQEAESVSDEAIAEEAPPTGPLGPPVRSLSAADDMGDAAAVVGSSEPAPSGPRPDSSALNWDRECSTQRIAVELKKIEAEVRKILDDRDPRRKRRLAGTRRWRELEDDIMALRYTGRIEESALNSLQTLVSRRHYLFGRLRFLAHTRPGWNS